jgi:hypothetical protein
LLMLTTMVWHDNLQFLYGTNPIASPRKDK